jgi:hypothetical protein
MAEKNTERRHSKIFAACLIASMALPAIASAQMSPMAAMMQQGGILATSGVATISGVGGGGINPWATIIGYDTNDEIGFNAAYTHVSPGSYKLDAFSASVGLFNRVELSVAQQNFDLGAPGASLGLGSDYNLKQQIFGAKVRLFGNVLYDQGIMLPQVAVGVNYHHNITGVFPGTSIPLVDAVGAHPDGTTFYVTAAKLFIDGLFGHYTFIDAGARLTNSNYNGLLGFGGTNAAGVYKSGYHVEPFVSVAQFINPQIAFGYEYRAMPHYDVGGALNLNTTNAWQDVFAAYLPTKNIALVAAYANLGTIAGAKNSNGLYLSLNASF